MEKMKPYIQKNNLDGYLDKEYTGYYWMSNEPVPNLVNGKFTLTDIGNNPFVIEANFYAKDGSISVSLDHIDGKYLIGILDWKQVDDTIVLEEQNYLTHRLTEIEGAEDYGKARFVRAWIPFEDPECEGMEVLQPAWRAFKGFVKVINLNKENL